MRSDEQTSPAALNGEPTAQSAGMPERGQILDSRFHGHMYATDASRAIFSDCARLQRWLDVEAALALGQADIGMIPHASAQAIAAAARLELLDLDWVAQETRRTSHSLVGLLRALQHVCPPEAGEFVHYGATTQDIQDTAQALEMRAVLAELERELLEILAVLMSLARSNLASVMPGRTHAQPALPITFGLKVASWIDELLRDMQRIDEARRRVLVAELFGGVGTMAAFGADGLELLQRFATRLELRVPALAWHASRDRVAEYVFTLAGTCATLARCADEIRTLSRPEIGELRQRWRHGKVGSSTMPHKRNPEECEQVVVLARLAAAQVPITLQAMIVEHERDSRELRTEWVTVADVSHYTLAAAGFTREIVAGIEVEVAAMDENSTRLAADLGTERLMLTLGERIGKQSAYEVIYELSQAAKSSASSLRERLEGDGPGSCMLTSSEVAQAFDPQTYVGLAGQLVERVLAEAERRTAVGTRSAAGTR
jgi:adenylosuccinate lyase